jgi:hypothetical protein
MPHLTEAVRRYIGMETPLLQACDPVEAGAVRRYAQAIMDADSIYMSENDGTRYGAPVAPPLFPNAMMRTAFGEPDLIQLRADDPDFDGAVGSSTLGLPPLPIENSPLLNGGSEVELFRFVVHNERVSIQSRYLSVAEKMTQKGPILVVVIETDFRDARNELIMRFRKTQLRR